MYRKLKAENVGLLIFLLINGLIFGGNQLTLSRSETKIELKPLMISGPTLAEVNETISFKVTSEGLPVKGATVYFAGYKKETDDNGMASFKIDFAGTFKAVAEKEGYKTNSTLLLVFPKGNDEFNIRSTKSMTDPQMLGDFDYAGRMAGFNFARIKAYYTYDEEGNVYPVIITLGAAEELSAEAAEIIKEKYPGEAPRRNLWIRVPDDIHLKYLAWMISRARDWGLKIYLHAQLFYVEPKTGEMLDVHYGPPLSEEVKKTFLEQRRKQALILASFAEEKGVELLDPLTFSTLLPKEEFLLYKELLPELRKVYSGKLVISDPREAGFSLDDFNLSGFDYIVVLPGWASRSPDMDPSEWKDAIHKYLEYAESVASKYGVKVLPMYLGHIDWIMNSYTSKESFEKFMSNFNSTEDTRIWFINLLFREISVRKNIAGADVHPLWFFGMLYPIYDGEVYQRFSYWPTRKTLNLASQYFSKPWNKEGKNALNMLRHIELAVNSITARSSNLALVNWASELLKKALKTYEEGDYRFTIEISHEVLNFFSHVENPLSIIIDGNEEDWKYLDPVYFNPSRTFPQFNLVWCYRNDSKVGRELREMGNLRSVYAVNDRENLYLMLDFYDNPPKRLPNIAIDVSGYWSHKFGEEFHIPLRDGIVEIWKTAYVSNEFNPQGPGSEKVGVCEVKVGKVVEVKIPLKILGNPRKVNLVVWYPWIAPWGDMEVDLVNWSILPSTSSISMSISSNKLLVGENVIVSGFIYPAHPNSKVTLTYIMPNGTTLTRNVTTKALGEFEDIVTPSIVGNWTVKASWSGDYDHEAAVSRELSFSVLKAKSSLSLLISRENLKKGEQITISGFINPPLTGIAVTLTFKKPNGLTLTETILTDINGSFSYTFTPKDVGKWSVNASWLGDENHEGASSLSLSFTVEEQPWWQEYWYLIASIIIICTASILSLKIKTKRKL